MASVKDVERIADELERLVGNLRSELQGSPDFEQLTQIADEISERADHAAETFSTVSWQKIRNASRASTPRPFKMAPASLAKLSLTAWYTLDRYLTLSAVLKSVM